ncbi:enediyne antibiotic chromoprotein [Actinomadura terrae]|uniref:enediyne antibiotic chromoprotein n=1 Tax=Actinomadura terrae TaxID=604353 RepID=UPI001FA77D1A|nr:enediyne antibiotic chromoprotein [Actinomadura terrae]
MFDKTRVTSGNRLLTKLGVGGALALGLAVTTLSGPAQAAAAATVTVTPNTGLQDGQSVTLSATGLTPNSAQHLGECTLTPDNQPACLDLGTIQSQADGSASTTLTVHKTFEAKVGDTPYGTVDCATAALCFIGVSDDGGPGGTGNGALISFQ